MCGVVTVTEKNDLEMLTEINLNFHIENIWRGMTPKIANLSLQIIHKQTENYLLLCNDFFPPSQMETIAGEFISIKLVARFQQNGFNVKTMILLFL